MKRRQAVRLKLVPGSELGWSPASAWFLLSKDEAHGPFATREDAVAASHRNKGSFGYGNITPDLSFLFLQGTRDPQAAQVRRESRPHST